MAKAAVWFATVGGLGRLPWAPGTWGSVAGLALGVALARHAPAPVAWAVLALLCVLAVPVCGTAERALGGHDPAPIVLDECCAMALTILALPWVTTSWGGLAGAFLAFRAFDIMKLPPLPRIERWPGGWGILGDDLGAAIYAIAALSAARLVLP